MPSFRVLNASLLISTGVLPRWQRNTCQLSVCTDRLYSEGCQERFSVLLPGVDVSNRRVELRPNLLYYYWQKPSSAVELKTNGNQMNCDNIKFYWIMDNIRQGQLIIQYNIPSTMVQIVCMIVPVYIMCLEIITRTIQCEL